MATADDVWPTSDSDRLELLREPSRLLGELLGRELPDDAVRPVFQPIVELGTGSPVGFEALTRGPAGTDLESPGRLFAVAAAAGRMADFDRACRDAALASAHLGGLEPPLAVFVNVEAELVEEPWERDVRQTWVHAPHELRCIIELTERDLTARPAALLHAVARVRERSWGVALDDVGSDPRSLALMALLKPDVIKLDMHLVQRRPDREAADVIAAVHAQASATGALVVAEGIETDEHLQLATALGAPLGQGFRFGRPAPAPDPAPRAGGAIRFGGSALRPDGRTPFDVVREHQPLRRAAVEEVHALIHHLELLAAGLGPATVALAAMDPSSFWSNGSEAMESLGRRAALAGVIGVPYSDDLPFRTGTLEAGDPLELECGIVVLAPHFSAVVAARRVGDATDGEPRFDYVVTHDRELVAACGRALAARLEPAP